MRHLFARMAYHNLPFYANPPGEGDGGGDGGDESGDDVFDFDNEDDFDDSFDGGDDGLDDDSEITDDQSKILGEFWKSPEGGQDEDDSSGTGGNDVAAQQAALAKEMEDSLNSMAIPEDMIPEDFNPSDPRSMRELLTNVHRHVSRQTIAVMFKPVQAALGGIVTQLRQEMQQASSSAVGRQKAESALMRAIPAYANPGVRPVVEMLFKQAQARFPGNLKKQVISTRKATQAIGIGTTSRSNSQGRSPSRNRDTGGMATGNAALDMFAKLPQPKPSGNRSNNQSRSQQLNNRMRFSGN